MRVFRGVPAVARAPVALTIGNFDGVHLGHQAMLARLRSAADSLGAPACVMTFEPHPREFFAPDRAPARLTSLREKLELLAAQRVDEAYVFRFNYAFAQIPAPEFIDRILVRGLGVRWLQVGDDFRFGARRAGDINVLKQAAARSGFDVEAMPTVASGGGRISSTSVRDALLEGDLARAARLLGRPYSVSGRVVRGDAIGRKLGFPTANVQMKRNRPPLTGIYAVELHRAGAAVLRGAASLGVRPTVTQAGAPVLEVHALDFSGDLYGQHVRVDFFHKLRDEEKYADLETLTRQIAVDVDNAKAYFHREDAGRGRERQAH